MGLGKWFKTARDIASRLPKAMELHERTPLEAYVHLLGPQRAHALFNSPLGDVLLRIDENRLIFEPDRICPSMERYQPKNAWADPDDPATYGLEGYKKLTLQGPCMERYGESYHEQYTAWYKPPEDPSCPTIAYFHGSASTLDVRAPILDELAKRRRGCGVIIVAYPGFRGSKWDSMTWPQEPSMAGLYRAGEAMVNYVHEHTPQSKITLFGESMGGAVALHTAHVMEQKGVAPAAVVCLNTFYSVPEWIHMAFDRLDTSHIKNTFDSGAVIGKIKAPILLLHGTEDEITHPEHSVKLKRKADIDRHLMEEPSNVTLVLLPGLNHRVTAPPRKKFSQNGNGIPEMPPSDQWLIDTKQVARIVTQVQDFITLHRPQADTVRSAETPPRHVERWHRRQGSLPGGHATAAAQRPDQAAARG